MIWKKKLFQSLCVYLNTKGIQNYTNLSHISHSVGVELEICEQKTAVVCLFTFFSFWLESQFLFQFLFLWMVRVCGYVVVASLCISFCFAVFFSSSRCVFCFFIFVSLCILFGCRMTLKNVYQLLMKRETERAKKGFPMKWNFSEYVYLIAAKLVCATCVANWNWNINKYSNREKECNDYVIQAFRQYHL